MDNSRSMMQESHKKAEFKAASRRNQNRAFIFFGVVAVALHLSLLFIPLYSETPLDPQPVIQIEMVALPITDTVQPEETNEPVPEPVNADDISPEALSEPVRNEEQASASQQEISKITEVVTTTILQKQVDDMEWPEPDSKPLTLGIASITPLPANLTQPVLPYEPTVFEELYAPVQTELVDQWRDPNGTIQTVIRTAGGDTLCSSLARWDATNPFFEPVPMFRRCAGGGKRKP